MGSNGGLIGFDGWWLSPTHLKNMSSSIGITTPNIVEKKHVPNHQPAYEIAIDLRSASDMLTASFF